MPSPSARQSHMKVHMGKTPGLDSNDYIDDIAFKFNILNKTADYTVLAKESGSIFTTVGCAANIEFTLPTKADGLIYWFYICTDYEMTITSDAVNTMATFNNAAADALVFTQASEHLGNGVMVFSDGTLWYTAVCLGGAGATVVITDA